jgi:hypothetical protein
MAGHDGRTMSERATKEEASDLLAQLQQGGQPIPFWIWNRLLDFLEAAEGRLPRLATVIRTAARRVKRRERLANERSDDATLR